MSRGRAGEYYRETEVIVLLKYIALPTLQRQQLVCDKIWAHTLLPPHGIARAASACLEMFVHVAPSEGARLCSYLYLKVALAPAVKIVPFVKLSECCGCGGAASEQRPMGHAGRVAGCWAVNEVRFEQTTRQQMRRASARHYHFDAASLSTELFVSILYGGAVSVTSVPATLLESWLLVHARSGARRGNGEGSRSAEEHLRL